MEFRKMVTITLYTRQQKRHWCIEQSFGLCGRGRGWDDFGEWHWNMYSIIYETSCQSRIDAMLDAWGWCTGMTQRDDTGREEGGGVRMGNTCIPVADSCWYMAKPIQYVKLKKNQQFAGIVHNSPPIIFGKSLFWHCQNLVFGIYQSSIYQEFSWSKIVLQLNSVCVCVLVAHSCPNLCDRTDCSPPGSSVHGIPQARILEWVAVPFSMWI